MKKCVNKTFLTLDIMVNIEFCLINNLILKKIGELKKEKKKKLNLLLIF